jgi:hypothetical protein
VRAAALGTALAAAVILPSGPPGIGVPLVAALVAGTVLLRSGLSRDVLVFGPPALALASASALRDAGWVVAIDLVAAMLLATVAVGGARLAALLAPVAALRDVPGIIPRVDGRHAPALRGALAGGLLVLPFGALFWTGDAAFAAFGSSLPVPSVESAPARVFTFASVLVGTVGLALATASRIALPRLDVTRRSLLEWALPMTALVALFLVFVAVQARVLFAGHDYVRRTTGLTYAEYARQGFWQLLAIAALALVVIGAASRLAEVRTPRERLVFRTLLGLLALLSLIVVASTLHRLDLYESTFGLTRLRLFAEAVSLWLGALFVLFLVTGVAQRVRQGLAGIAVGLTAAGLIAFTLANPDRLIAEHNIDRWRHTRRIDIDYLANMSADATPAVATLPEPLRSMALGPIGRRLTRGEPWSSANLARHDARSTIVRVVGSVG